MKNPPPLTRLILLPLHADMPVTWLQIEQGGRIACHQTLAPGTPLPVQSARRDIVALPGEAISVLWLDLPTRHPLQARAAARLRLEDHVAVPVEQLHIALAAAPEPGAPSMVAVVDQATMAEWKKRCTLLGVTDAVWVPDCLLVDAPEAPTLRAATLDGRLQVRGQRSAFTAEASLAFAIAGDVAVQVVPPSESIELLAHAAAQPPLLDLLQFEHARPDTQAGRRRRRRLLLAAAVLLSPLLVAGAQTVRDVAWASSLDRRADALASQFLPASAQGDDASRALRALVQQRRAPDRMAVDATTLFTAIDQQPGSQLDSFEFDVEEGLRVGIIHRDEQQLEAIRVALEQEQVSLVALESSPVEGAIRSLVSIGGMQ